MQSEVEVKFSEAQRFRMGAGDILELSDEAARAWLDQQYNEYGCVPTNPVGKVLSVDKVLSVARAAGPGAFADRAWARTFARAAIATLHRPVVRIDVADATVGF
jgi:hypothetical protein